MGHGFLMWMARGNGWHQLSIKVAGQQVTCMIIAKAWPDPAIAFCRQAS
jgi:hypothetical protein